MSVESITPYNNGQRKREQITQAFDVLAHRYDRLNRCLSLGIDLHWRRRALRHLQANPPARLLDVATGTADLAIMAAHMLPQTHVTGIDLSESMLTVGRDKVQAAGLEKRITLAQGDCLALPYAEGSFDAATAAFGVRNFESLPAGLAELRRVLKPGGNAVILELSRPERQPAQTLFRFYMRVLMPFIGRCLSGHAREYRYLPASIEHVPQGEAMLALLRDAGFTACRLERYTLGVCTCYTARTPSP